MLSSVMGKTGVMDIASALKIAEGKNSDLVEIHPVKPGEEGERHKYRSKCG